MEFIVFLVSHDKRNSLLRTKLLLLLLLLLCRLCFLGSIYSNKNNNNKKLCCQDIDNKTQTTFFILLGEFQLQLFSYFYQSQNFCQKYFFRPKKLRTNQRNEWRNIRKKKKITTRFLLTYENKLHKITL